MKKNEMLVVRTMLARSFEHSTSLRGYDIFEDLIEDTFWSTVCVSLGGRRLTADEARLMDALSNVVPLGDPRIWPLKLTRLIGSYGRSFTGMAGGYTMMDGAIFGPYPTSAAAHFFAHAIEGAETDEERAVAVRAAVDEAMTSGDRVPAFGVAGRAIDERCVAFFRWHDKNMKESGKHWKAYVEAHTYMTERYGLQPNIGGPIAVIGLDLGIELDAIAAFASFLTHWAFVANALEATRESPDVLRRLPAHCILWDGPEARQSPRALAEATAHQVREEHVGD